MIRAEPAGEGQEAGRKERVGIEDVLDLFQILGPGRPRQPQMDQESRELPAAEGGRDSDADPGPLLQRGRDDVGKRAEDGQGKNDLRIDIHFFPRKAMTFFISSQTSFFSFRFPSLRTR